MTTTKQKSPHQAQRDRVSSSIEARGETASNIWLVRPPFSTRDLVLSSDLQRQAFYLLEGEQSFTQIDYADPWWAGAGARCARGAPQHFASAFTNAGARCEIFLQFGRESTVTSPLTETGGRWDVGDRTLKANAQRVENWPRIIACIRRLLVGTSPVLERRILFEFASTKVMTVRELAARLSDVNAAVLRGTACALLRKREIASDLDVAPWSMSTKLRMGEDA